MKTVLCCLAFALGIVLVVMFDSNNDQPETASASMESAGTPAVVTASLTEEISGRSDSARPVEVALADEVSVTRNAYGKLPDGTEINEFVCVNKNGLEMRLIDYGATVISLRTPDRSGEFENITLSCKELDGYLACKSYFGCTVGRYCNRIAKGRFSIDGKVFQLAANNGQNHLHGGNVGFDKKVWKAEPIKQADAGGVRFTLTSPDGDEGYPGQLSATAEYLLTNSNEMIVDLKATTTKTTHVNLTNHNYWNLRGGGLGDILEHQLQINGGKYIPVDNEGIPTGEIRGVTNTPFDFTSFHKIGERLKQVGGEPVGYDHCYALDGQAGKMQLAAVVEDPDSGRKMEIHTTLPGLQFYSGNFLDGQPGSGGFSRHAAFCLETQRYPDTPNRSEFPTTLLKPGETYHERTIHKFSVAQ
jgi:aldose 1-epimerase